MAAALGLAAAILVTVLAVRDRAAGAAGWGLGALVATLGFAAVPALLFAASCGEGCFR